MISRLPRWAWYGSGALALNAGIINAVGFLGFQHQGVTHLTGTTTLLGISIAGRDASLALQLGAIVAAFVTGCIVSGLLIRDPALKLGRHYGSALALESVLLFAAAWMMGRAHMAGACLASAACGLQNGMVSTYSGAALRTTHVSGAITDLGILLGQRLGGTAIDGRRLRLVTLLIGAFLVGTITGAAGFRTFGYPLLHLPALAIGAVALAYVIYLRRRAPG